MRIATLAVHEDEKAWRLSERNAVRPPGFKLHRYQVITVVRDDNLAEWWHDLGPAERFIAPEFEVPSFFEHSVAELREIAGLQHRDAGPHWQQFMAEKAAESTLIPDFLEYVEENWKRIRNESTFGPGGATQRNGFDRKAALTQ
jgi:hypothetical protein